MRPGHFFLLALLIGFLSYRVALATFPTDQMWAQTVEARAGTHFDAVTGIVVSPPSSQLYPESPMFAHWYRSALFGLAVVPLAFIALWWLARRRRAARQQRSDAVRGIITTLALALCLLGCASEPVKLLTGGHEGCSIGGTAPMTLVGDLIADSQAGTAIRVEPSDTEWPHIAGRTVPVMWPPGFTGRRLPSGEVEVVAADGSVAITTGRRVVLSTQFMGGGSARSYTACGGREFVPEPPPPLLFDLAAVKAKFEAECEDPSLLENKTCEQIDIDGMHGESPRSLWVPTDRTEHERLYERLKVMCKELARFAADGEPLGFEDITVLASSGRLRAGCRVPG